MLNGNLKFSTTKELNDPCELADEINETLVAHSLTEFRKSGYSSAEYEWLCRQGELLQSLSPSNQAIAVPRSKELAHDQIMSDFYDDIGQMSKLQRNAVRNIREKAGILSLTTNWQNLPMWAHYANNAKGFVVIFESLKQAFTGDKTGVLNEVQEVSYSDVFEGMTFKPSSQRNLFFCKFNDWSYEREVRVISSLKECYEKQIGENTKIWLRDIDPKHISGVILGWNVDEATRSKLLKFQPEIRREIQVFQASVKGVSVTKTRIDISQY